MRTRTAAAAFAAALAFQLPFTLVHAAPGDPDPLLGTGGQARVQVSKAVHFGTGLAFTTSGLVGSFRSTGFENSYGGLIGFKADGSIDTAFGNGGTVNAGPPVYGVKATGGNLIVAQTKPAFNGFDEVAGVPYRILTLSRYSEAGVFDPTFGSGGRTALFNASLDSGFQEFLAVTVAPDGKLVAAGYAKAGNAGVNQILIARYNANGTLDTSFAGIGYARFALPGGGYTYAGAVGVLPDNSIVVAGAQGSVGYVARVLANGSGLDLAFGGNGAAYPLFTSGCSSLVVEAARVIVGCNTNAADRDFYVGAFLFTGVPDPGSTAITVDVGSVGDNLTGLTVGPTGTIYATGTGTTGRLVVVAINPAGGIVPGFASGGIYTMPEAEPSAGGAILAGSGPVFAFGTRVSGNTNVQFAGFDPATGSRGFATYPATLGGTNGLFRVRPQGGGTVLASGMQGDFATGFHSATRFTASGVVDTGFGVGGTTRIAIPNVAENISTRDLRIDSSGRILVTGDYGGVIAGVAQVGVTRLLTSGGGDPAFNAGGTPGYSVVPLVGFSAGFSRAVREVAGGKILALSTGQSGAFRQIAIARFNSDGTPDGTYGTSGVAYSAFSSNSTGRDMDVDETGRAVAVSSSGPQVRIVRFTPAGAPDGTFGISGQVSLSLPAGHNLRLPNRVFALPGGKTLIVITAGKAVGDGFLVARLNSDGSPDTTYSGDGFAEIPAAPSGLGLSNAWDAVILPNKKLVIAAFVNSDTVPFYAAAIRLNVDGTLDTTFGTGGYRAYTDPSGDLVLNGIDTFADGSLALVGSLAIGARNYGLVLKTVADPSALVVSAARDANGDGKSDLFWQNTAAGDVQGWLMNGLTASAVAGLLPVGGGYTITKIADLNGDGKADLLIGHTDGSVIGWLMNGLSVTGNTTLAPAGSGWTIAKTGDLNGDGNADLLFQHADGTVQGWLMNGLSVASTATFVGAGSGWTPIQVADLNGDGKADVLWRHTDGSVQAWLMNGLSVSSIASLAAAGSGWTVVLTADFDGDGKADLMWQHTSGATQTWLMNGLSATSLASFTAAGSGWTPVLAGDLNGDAKADLFWQHTSGASQTWLMDGLSVTGLAGFVGAGAWSATHLLDFDGDGRKDICWRNADGSVKAWLMNGLTVSGIASLAPAGTYLMIPPMQ